MMRLLKIFAAGTAGTAVMTLFSYLVTKAAKKNFVEPVILSELLGRITPLNKRDSQLAGWGAHLGVGVVFTAIYDEYLNLRKKSPTLANTLMLGLLGGTTGVVVWHAAFKAHPNPPGVDLENFYKQLIVAHLVFAAGAALVYKVDELQPDGIEYEPQHEESFFI